MAVGELNWWKRVHWGWSSVWSQVSCGESPRMTRKSEP